MQPVAAQPISLKSDRDQYDGDVVVTAGPQGVVDQCSRRDGGMGSVAERRDVSGLGQVVVQAVRTQQQHAAVGGRRRAHTRVVPPFRFGVATEPLGKGVRTLLYDMRVGRYARGDQSLCKGIIDGQASGLGGRLGPGGARARVPRCGR